MALLISATAYPSQNTNRNRFNDNPQARVLNAKAEAVEIIEGVPSRPFQKIAPLWESSSSIDSAIKRMKKSASKKGADAIIDFVVESKDQGIYGISSPVPVVKGWAIKWE